MSDHAASHTNTALLPWQHSQFKRLQMLASNDRLAHGWLFSGKPGIGKLGFARHFARFLLCRHSDANGPCGRCQDCNLFSARTHPDALLVLPEALEQQLFPDDGKKGKDKPSRQLKIEQIRDAIEFAQATAQRGGAKVIIINPAEAMNINSANALLKILEEPPARTFLLLVSEQPGLLLATLRSRCQQLAFTAPPTDQALQWLRAQDGCPSDAAFYLQLAEGAPLHALQLAADNAGVGFRQLWQSVHGVCTGEATPVQAAKACEGLGILNAVNYQLIGLAALLASNQAGIALTIDSLQPLQALCPPAAGIGMVRRLHGLHRSLVEARKVALATNNANALLMLEALFAEWATVTAVKPARRSQGL